MNKNFLLRIFIPALLLCPFAASAQKPVADFSGNVTKGCGSLVVKFTDLSTNSPTSWLWDFGNGNTSAFQNPTAFYGTPGTYTVKLTATNASGSDTKTKVGYIIVYKEPAPQFTADDTAGCVSHTVNFTDLSVPGDKPITTWLWDFGDGTTSSSQNPSHTFTASGTYQISLSVTDGNGCLKKIIKTTYIIVTAAPTAGFTGTPLQSCYPPLTVNFTSSSAGSGLKYLWVFGDGATDSVQNPSHTYNNSGTYHVTLIVTDQNGCVDSLTRTGYVVVNNFTANFGMDDSTGCFPHAVNFSDSTSGSNSWTWNFGDGGTSTAKNPSHTYNAPGTYTVTLISGSSAGCKDTITKTVTVYPSPVPAFGTSDTTACKAPFNVTFTDLTPGAASWVWDFGDGSGTSNQNPAHTYNAPGLYTVRLIVTDTNGCVDTLIKTQHVRIVEPVADFTAIPRKGCKPLLVNFTDISFSNETKTSWFWDFGDGSTSTLQNPSHTFADTGCYNITLRVTNIEGCADTLVRNDYICVGIQPVPEFTQSDTVGCHPLFVQFTDSSSNYTNEWIWLFGDGGSSAQQHPGYVYRDTGYFTVTLIAGHYGCYDTIIKPLLIHVLPPKPIFTATPVIGCYYPHTVTFTDQSKGAETWFWDFGDGTTFTGQNPPPHVYANPGFYTVKLVVTNSNGCKDSLVVPAYIKVSEIRPGFVQSKTTGCKPLNVTFTDTSYANTPIVTWTWDFGDGFTLSGNGNIPAGTHGGLTSGTYKSPTHTYQSPDTFSITLIVTDQLGCKDTIVKKTLVVKQLPVVQFAADSIKGCAPLTVNFTDSSLASPPASLVSWTWNFGDGSPVSNLQNPSHTYALRGSYTVSLSVTDNEGCTNVLTKTAYIIPTRPYAAFTFDSTVCSYETVSFVNTSTPSAGLTYLWDFGDGNTSAAVSPTHSYVVNSTTFFTVTLTATDANGCDSVVTKTIRVSKPDAGFFVNATISDCPPFFVTFTDTSKGGLSRIEWDFGNGSKIKDTTYAAGDTVASVYVAPGKYSVQVIVTDTFGCKDTLRRDSLITVGGPSGTFTFSPKNGCAPLTVTFIANTTNAELYEWVFGDGSSDSISGDTAVHTYVNSGVFHPVLIIKDSLDKSIGDTVRCEFTITVPDSIVISGPTVDFIASGDTLCSGGGTIQFTDLTTPSGSYNYLWEFGDGDSSSLQNPSHNFDSIGDYWVKLNVLIGACRYTDSLRITVFTPPAVQVFPDTAGCKPLYVTFSFDSSTITYPYASWIWNSGTGDTSTQANPTFVYTSSGTYTPDLTITFGNGCKAIYPASVLVYPSPTAGFTIDPVFEGFLIKSLRFNNTSTGATSYWWSFGDGSTSATPSPVYSYSTEGVYTITLVAWNQYGCPDTVIRTDTVTRLIFIPNIFTPDGDGENETFYLRIPAELDHFRLVVYNRWGLKVYENNNYKNDWKGTDMKGDLLNDDTYYYILTYYDQISWNGWVRILSGKKH